MDTPLRWKKLCAIWLGMYPVNVASSWVITMLPWWGDVTLPARSAIVVSFVAPLMTFIMMPTLTRLLDPWLRHRRAHVERERGLVAALDAIAMPLSAQPDSLPNQTATLRPSTCEACYCDRQ